MTSFLSRLLHGLRGTPRTEARPRVGLDPEKAEQGLHLSNLDGDAHTTEALAEELGMAPPPPPEDGREAA